MKVAKEYLLESLNHEMGYYFKASDLLYEIQTKYQKLEICNVKNYGKILRLDGIFQTSEVDEFLYHEPLVHVPAITMDGPKNALVIGGGDGGSIEELLKYDTIQKLVMIELDDMVVKKCKEYMPDISKGAFDSNKLELLFHDGKKYLEDTEQKFDQIVLDLTDAFGPSLSLYTSEFYQRVREALELRGILSLHIESPITQPLAFKRIFWTLKSVFKNVEVMLNYVPLYGSLWGFAVASNYFSPSLTSKVDIKDRLKKFQLSDLKFYDPETHYSILTIPSYIRNLLKEPAEIVSESNKNSISEIVLNDLQICLSG